MDSVRPEPSTLMIVGAGPGIGAATARRFGREGFQVGLVARDRTKLTALADELGAEGVRTAVATADARRPGEVGPALRWLETQLGPTDVLYFGPLPDIKLIKPVLATTAADLIASLELNVGGAAAAVSEVVPAMRAQGCGTLLFTTGSRGLTPSAERASSGVTTSAAAVYIRMLHDALTAEAIHVAHVVVVGPVGRGKQHEPDAVAETLWQQYVRRDSALTVIR